MKFMKTVATTTALFSLFSISPLLAASNSGSSSQQPRGVPSISGGSTKHLPGDDQRGSSLSSSARLLSTSLSSEGGHQQGETKDEVIQIRKRDGRLEALDGSKVSTNAFALVGNKKE